MEHRPAETLENSRILVVDDDPGIVQLVSDFLRRHGYNVIAAANAREMELRIAEAAPDLIILDLMLPGEGGLSICRRLSANGGPPIIMMSALAEEADRIVGLEVGADDYLPKPCSPRELLARVRAVLRRQRRQSAETADSDGVLGFAGWRLDLLKRELRSPQDLAVPLSTSEYALLCVLVERPFRVLTRDQLLDLTRGLEADSYDRAIDVLISRLRRKLAEHEGGELIQTIRNEGYRFGTQVLRL